MKRALYNTKIIIGFISMVFAVRLLLLSGGSSSDYITYGGDAYTGIQQAAAQTANNVLALGEITKYIGFSILMIVGLILLVPSAVALHYINKEASDSTTAQPDAPEDCNTANPPEADNIGSKNIN